MTNPRIVEGRKGSGILLSARGRVLGATFMLSVAPEAAKGHDRLELGDRLLEEARGILRQASQRGSFPWEEHNFAHNADHNVWEKTLTPEDVARLMGR